MTLLKFILVLFQLVFAIHGQYAVYKPNLFAMKSASINSKTNFSTKHSSRLLSNANCGGDISQTDTPFGIGGTDLAGYDHKISCKWTLSFPEDGMALVFTKFHTESGSDYVRVYFGAEEKGKERAYMSGDPLVPHVMKIPDGTRTVTVTFESDESYDATPEKFTLQLGFQALIHGKGTCYNDCSGHGQCVANVNTCNCDDDYVADDCSVYVPTITADTTVDINELAVGDWKYFKFISDKHFSWLVDLVDIGHPDSSAFLLGGFKRVPRLAVNSFDYTDWMDWFYDRTDVHFIRNRFAQKDSMYYVGVTNSKLRAKKPFTGKLTLRLSSFATYPCLLNCSNHGVCDQIHGICNCNKGWESSRWNSPTSCRFPIEAASLDSTVQVDDLRIGDWKYYSVNVTKEQAGKRHLLVDFRSKAPHSQPIVLVRRGEVPRLEEGLIPTYEAFYSDYGDQEGFEGDRGQRQTVLVPAKELTEGEWYVGVYNIWGFTKTGVESHDSADFTIYINLYAAGKPCPMSEGQFCAGAKCNFNDGKCKCNPGEYGEDCSIKTQLIEPGKVLTGSLGINDTHYFRIEVTEEIMATLGRNLDIRMEKPKGQKSSPMLLVKKGGVPTGYANSEMNASGDYADHDFLANYHHQVEHRIVLNRAELSSGDWIISLQNREKEEENEEKLTYSLKVKFGDMMECPKNPITKQVCSGRGSCDKTLGQCVCTKGYTLDDCSALGITELQPKSVFKGSKDHSIAIDSWAFFSFFIGCPNMGFSLDFQTKNKAAKPGLFVRYGKLPLMIGGTYDFSDYYDHGRYGREHYIQVEGCLAQGDCIVHPPKDRRYGTIFSTQWNETLHENGPKAGVYYVGVYNDVSSKSIMDDYSLQMRYFNSTIGEDLSCSKLNQKCAEGFLGTNCDLNCPGILKTSGYTNAPMGKSRSCSGHGICSVGLSQDAECKCDAVHYGDDCSIGCPGAYINERGLNMPCAGHGTCSISPNLVYGRQVAECKCDVGFGGKGCTNSCPKKCSGHGDCVDRDLFGITISECKCMKGFAGLDCASTCPGGCHGHGVCTRDEDSGVTKCVCKEGFTGKECQQKCPGSILALDDPLALEHFNFTDSCSGNGTCVAISGGPLGSYGKCNCFQNSTGLACNEPYVPSTIIEGKNGVGSGWLVLLVFGIMMLSFGIFWLHRVNKRKQNHLQKYRAIFGDERVRGFLEDHGVDLRFDEEDDGSEPVISLGSIESEREGVGRLNPLTTSESEIQLRNVGDWKQNGGGEDGSGKHHRLEEASEEETSDERSGNGSINLKGEAV
eukprot:g2417.t1